MRESAYSNNLDAAENGLFRPQEKRDGMIETSRRAHYTK